jgi:spore coat protein F
MNPYLARPQHLAWHETLELHELVAFQWVGLMKIKNTIDKIDEPTLRAIYAEAIQGLEVNLKELLQFYPLAPRPDSTEDTREFDASFFAADLLALFKTAVRNYAVAITETATPVLRNVFIKQQQAAIHLHGRIFYYMYERGLYPSYNLDQLLMNDVKNAQKAITMRY